MVNFTFKTESEYESARFRGYISDYQIARVKVLNEGNGYVDFPVHSKEEFINLVGSLEERGAKFEAYPATHCYDIQDYAE